MSIVAKFGGTSIANSKQIANALSLVRQHIDTGVVLVASAMGKTTNRLVEIVDTCAAGNCADGLKMLSDIREQHLSELASVTDHHIRSHAVERIELLSDEMQSLCSELCTQEMATNPQRAYLLAHGELLATTIVYALARWQGLPCELLDSRDFIKTDNQSLAAEVDWDMTARYIREQINLKAKKMYITPGFIASSQDGRTTTLGRGGSDYSAALIGAALGVTRIEIWTDVDGILTTDPRIVPSAQPVEALSYSEAAELSYFGASVIHPSTMIPAIKKDIPLVVRNTHNASHPGTTISQQAKQSGVCAIAVKRSVTLISVQSYRMLNAYGFLSRIFAIFADYRTAVDLVATSEVSISLTIDDDRHIVPIVGELEHFAKVETKGAQSIISIVAQGLWRDARTVARAFTALQTIPIQLVTLGGSDTNLSLVIDREYVQRAVAALHDAFFYHGAT